MGTLHNLFLLLLMVAVTSGSLKDPVTRYAQVRVVDFRGKRSGWGDFVEASMDGVGTGDLEGGILPLPKLRPIPPLIEQSKENLSLSAFFIALASILLLGIVRPL